MLGYVRISQWDIFSGIWFPIIQSYPNSQKISLNILRYPFISYHIPTYPKISSGANSQMYAMYTRHRISICDIRHCIRYVETNTYDVVCVTYDVVCWRTTSYVTYDIARTMSYVYILYIARMASYVRCSTWCRMSHVRCRTCMTYDIVRDVRHRRWQESRWMEGLRRWAGDTDSESILFKRIRVSH